MKPSHENYAEGLGYRLLRRLIVIGLILALIAGCALIAIALSQIYFALNAAAPATPTQVAIIPTLTPTATQTARSATYTPYPTRPAMTMTPALTATPHDIALTNLSPDEERMVRDGINLLKSCAPPMYDYVRSHIQMVTRGDDTSGTPMIAYQYTGRSIVYLPRSGTINDPRHYVDSLRTFVAAIVLVHQARLIELGRDATAPDAYGFTLPLFGPCRPNDIGDATTQHDWRTGPNQFVLYYDFRRYTEWRASLPYPGEPPPDITMPP